MKVDVTQRPELRVAAVRHTGSYQRVNEAFMKLSDIAGKAGLFRPDAKLVGIYYNDPDQTPEDKLQSDAALTVSAKAKIPPGLNEVVIPAGTYAHLTHRGPYTGSRDAWGHLRLEWLPKSGHRIAEGLSYEVYPNNPGNAKPEDLITEIYLPVEE